VSDRARRRALVCSATFSALGYCGISPRSNMSWIGHLSSGEGADSLVAEIVLSPSDFLFASCLFPVCLPARL